MSKALPSEVAKTMALFAEPAFLKVRPEQQHPITTVATVQRNRRAPTIRAMPLFPWQSAHRVVLSTDTTEMLFSAVRGVNSQRVVACVRVRDLNGIAAC